MADSKYRKLKRSKSESCLSERKQQRLERSKSLRDVNYSRALEDQMRAEIYRLREDLKREERTVDLIKKENVLDILSTREEDREDSILVQKELALKFMQEKNHDVMEAEEIARSEMRKDAFEREREKDVEISRMKRAWEYEKEFLINTLSDQFRTEARSDYEGEFERARKKYEIDYYTFLSEKTKLQEDLKIAKTADKEKAEEMRRVYHDHNKAMADLKKDASQDSRRQVNEATKLDLLVV